jgi:hypothetical protein
LGDPFDLEKEWRDAHQRQKGETEPSGGIREPVFDALAGHRREFERFFLQGVVEAEPMRSGRNLAGKRLAVQQGGHACAVKFQVYLPLADVPGEGSADDERGGLFRFGSGVRQSVSLYLSDGNRRAAEAGIRRSRCDQCLQR